MHTDSIMEVYNINKNYSTMGKNNERQFTITLSERQLKLLAIMRSFPTRVMKISLVKA